MPRRTARPAKHALLRQLPDGRRILVGEVNLRLYPEADVVRIFHRGRTNHAFLCFGVFTVLIQHRRRAREPIQPEVGVFAKRLAFQIFPTEYDAISAHPKVGVRLFQHHRLGRIVLVCVFVHLAPFAQIEKRRSRRGCYSR